MQKGLFHRTFILNPQIYEKLPLKPKSDEAITDVVFKTAALTWGIVNFDGIFNNAVARCLRAHGPPPPPPPSRAPSPCHIWSVLCHLPLPCPASLHPSPQPTLSLSDHALLCCRFYSPQAWQGGWKFT